MNQGPIRVLCVMSTLDRGGAESMCMNLYRHIDRTKIQFDFVKHTSDKGAFEDEIISLGGRIYEAPRFTPTSLVKYIKWWKKHLQSHPEHQIIHGHFFTISPVFFTVAKRMNRITVGHIHASSSDGLLKKILCKRISSVTDYPLACSQQAGRWIYGERPFTVLNNGLDSMRFRYSPATRERIRQILGLGDTLTLGTVANLSPVKNPMGLIDIFLAIRERIKDAQLIWVGEGAQRQMIESRLKEENITECVKLLGARNDVPDILQAMDVFLLPSLSEGLPVSVIEAQAAGLPCFISDHITKETDISGLCHFLPIDEPTIWAKEIVKNQTIRKDTSDKIREAKYDIHTTAKWIEDFYLGIQTH